MPDYDYSIQYRRWHDESPEHERKMIEFCRGLLGKHLPESKDAPILDIGCGMGFALCYLRDAGYQDVLGVDIDVSQIEACGRKGLRVNYTEDTVRFLETMAPKFRVVLMLDVLEHIPVPQQIAFLRAVRRVTVPGGSLVLTVPNAVSPVSSFYRYIDYTHYAAFSPHSLRFVLLNAGFSSVNIPADGQPAKRPPLRLWRSSVRRAFRAWVFRWLWHQLLSSELLGEDVANFPLNPNILCIASA
jgi:SAM-dependent methyltransferase